MATDRSHRFRSLRRLWQRKKVKDVPEFHYSSIESTQIRLLRLMVDEGGPLSCRLETYQLDNCPSFIALSYTWGSARLLDEQHMSDTSQKSKSVMCNGGIVHITPNLSDACSQLIHSRPNMYFWIDAICINQNDLREKAEQVVNMSEIYRNADEVIVWLGLPCDSLQDFIWSIEKLYPAFEAFCEAGGDRNIIYKNLSDSTVAQDLKLGTEDLLERLRGFYKFIDNRRWFSRIWTLQETVDTLKTVSLCGTSEIPFDTCLKAAAVFDSGYWHAAVEVQNVMDHSSHSLSPGFAARRVIYQTLASLRADTSSEKLTEKFHYLFGATSEHAKGMPWLIYILFMSKRFESTDHRDKIFAVQSLVQPYLSDLAKEILWPSYTLSKREVYLKFATFVLTNMSYTTLISLVDNHSARALPSLPTWVPTFSVYSDSYLPLAFLGNSSYDAMNCKQVSWGRHQVEDDVFICEGAQFDTVAQTCFLTNAQIGREHSISEFLKFCCILPKEMKGTDRVEAIWRTSIGNYVQDDETGRDWYPAPESLGTSFRHYLEREIAIQVYKHEDENVSLDEIKGLLRQLDPFKTSKILPKEEIILKTLAAFACSPDDQGYDEALNFFLLRDQLADSYARAAELPSTGRRLFLTKRGFVGMGGVSTSINDRIVFLRGCLVPMVLRDSGIQDSLEVISDCYLHGFMNGEVLDDEWALKESMRSIRIT